MNAILIQQIYPGYGYDEILKTTEGYNAAYCAKHEMDYQCLYENPIEGHDPHEGAWAKIKLIQEAMQAGYEYIIWLDADALIVDTETDLRDAIELDHIGACWHRIPQLNHWNVGVLYIHNSPATADFMDRWMAHYPGKRQWMEQGVFNEMALHDRTVVTLSDKWNSTIDVSFVPDAVVLGFHGQGDPAYRSKLMQEVLRTLLSKQESEIVLE